MAVFRFKVTYTDGREMVAVAGAKIQVITEREMRGFGEHNKLDTMYRMARNALALSGQDGTDYDVWLDQVEDVEELGEDVDDNNRAPADPTSPAQSPDVSSN